MLRKQKSHVWVDVLRTHLAGLEGYLHLRFSRLKGFFQWIFGKMPK